MQTNRQTYKRTEIKTDRQMDRQTDIQTERKTDRQTNRQTESCKYARSPATIVCKNMNFLQTVLEQLELLELVNSKDS